MGTETRELGILEPDEQLTDQCSRALCGSAYGALRRVQVRVCHGVAILQGRAPSFYLKQMAQSLVATTPGIDDVDNRLVVTGGTDDNRSIVTAGKKTENRAGPFYADGPANGGTSMLVLTRKIGESIRIGDGIRVVVLRRKRGSIQLGIDAPDDISIYRAELKEPNERTHERTLARQG